MRDHENIMEVANMIAPDYMGFICYRSSPRYIGEDFIPPKDFPSDIKKVGVFVDEPFDSIMSISDHSGFDLVQLHGDETPEYCMRVRAEGKQTIKVFRIEKSLEQEKINEYSEAADFFLFDTYGAQYGGIGKAFNWHVLDGLNIPQPVFMSGGIDLKNVGPLLEENIPMYAIDVNSGFEDAPALKNTEDLKKLKTILNHGS